MAVGLYRDSFTFFRQCQYTHTHTHSGVSVSPVGSYFNLNVNDCVLW
jgi:hypothetical protein